MDTADTNGILGSECCADTCPIAVQCGEHPQVHLKQAQDESVNRLKILGECLADLDPGTSRRIISCDGQHGG